MPILRKNNLPIMVKKRFDIDITQGDHKNVFENLLLFEELFPKHAFLKDMLFRCIEESMKQYKLRKAQIAFEYLDMVMEVGPRSNWFGEVHCKMKEEAKKVRFRVRIRKIMEFLRYIRDALLGRNW